MQNSKPLVQAATLCDTVLAEPDKVASIIRLIDTVYLTLPPGAEPAEGEVGAVPLRIFVSLKAGAVRGEFDVELILRTPSGKQAIMPQKWHVAFQGDETTGAHLTINFLLPVREFGLYWYDVVWEGEVLTSIPFKLVEGPKPEAPERTPMKAKIG